VAAIAPPDFALPRPLPPSPRVTVFLVKDFKRADYPPPLYGRFYSAESFVILVEDPALKDNKTIFFWQGRDSPPLSRGSSALLTVGLDDEMGGDAPQIRVVQVRFN
jgi:hypothetical protein